MKPIDADALISDFKLFVSIAKPQTDRQQGVIGGLESVIDTINKAPTIDPDTLAPRWRDAKIEQPKENEEVFVYRKRNNKKSHRNKGFIEIDHFVTMLDGKPVWSQDHLYIKNDVEKYRVTHWQPLPELPKEGENDA